MILYCVTYNAGGYSREDNSQPAVAGIFTDPEIADKIKLCVSGSVHSIELDHIQPGYAQNIKDLFGVDLIRKITTGLKPFDRLDKECLMTAEDFLSDYNNDFLTDYDGHGYWATSTEVSSVSCFNNQPEWATHVCWYNK